MRYEGLSPPPEINGLDFSAEDKLMARQNGRMRLLTVLTDMGCNFKCPYCFTMGTRSSEREPLSLSEYKDLFRQAKELGVKSVWWVGLGEPLMYEGIWDFLELIKSLDLTPLVFTNGSLITKEVAKELFDVGASVYVKVNSFNPEIQDKLVGNIDGASYRMRKGLDNLLGVGFGNGEIHRIAIQSIITKENLYDIPGLYSWARDNSVIPFLEIIVYNGFTVSDYVTGIDLSTEEMEYIFNLLLKIDEEEYGYTWVPSPPYVGRQCDKYYYALTVNPYGDVLSCAASKFIIGNIRYQSLRGLWEHPFIKKTRRMDEFIEGKCRACEIACTGCRAEVYAKTRNVFGEFKRCWRK